MAAAAVAAQRAVSRTRAAESHTSRLARARAHTHAHSHIHTHTCTTTTTQVCVVGGAAAAAGSHCSRRAGAPAAAAAAAAAATHILSSSRGAAASSSARGSASSGASSGASSQWCGCSGGWCRQPGCLHDRCEPASGARQGERGCVARVCGTQPHSGVARTMWAPARQLPPPLLSLLALTHTHTQAPDTHAARAHHSLRAPQTCHTRSWPVSLESCSLCSSSCSAWRS
jgi:hypothetical protein